MVTTAKKLRRLLLGRRAMTNLDSILKSRDITLQRKVHLVKAMVFPVVMYGCEGWTIKKAEHWRIDAFELWCWRRLFESSLDCKEIKPVNPKGNRSWIFIGRTDAEAEAPILWPPDAKNWFIGKDPDAGNPGVLQSVGSQRFLQDWVTEQQQQQQQKDGIEILDKLMGYKSQNRHLALRRKLTFPWASFYTVWIFCMWR